MRGTNETKPKTEGKARTLTRAKTKAKIKERGAKIVAKCSKAKIVGDG